MAKKGASRPVQSMNYTRREPIREPYDLVLIICEGRKTEPLYLKNLRSVYRLSSANIEVMSAPGTDPMTIVKFGETHFRSGLYDKVFCVFDRDSFSNFDEALRHLSAAQGAQQDKFKAVVSWPCFELWLLLHFEYCTTAFARTSGASSCDRVIRKLRKHLPTYQKGDHHLYDTLHERQSAAIKNGNKLQAENHKTGSLNPSTQMHELVSYLIKLKDQ